MSESLCVQDRASQWRDRHKLSYVKYVREELPGAMFLLGEAKADKKMINCIDSQDYGHRLLKGRAGHSATLVGKKLFVLGGRNGNEFFNDLWVFDIESYEWLLHQKHAPFAPRAYHTATLIRPNRLWVIGGSDNVTMYGDVHVLDVDSLEWTSLVTKGPLAGKQRGTHAAVQHPLREKGILIYGGYGGLNCQWLQDLAVLQTDTLVWEELRPKGDAPGGRGYHSFTTVGTHVILFGGKGETGIVSSDAISVYDAEVNMWTTPRLRGTTPVSRSNHAATLVRDDLMMIHGGRNGSERLNDVCLLQVLSSPAAGRVDSFAWRILSQEKPKAQKKGRVLRSQGPGGRSAHILVVEDSTIYLFGGYGGNGITYNDIFATSLADVDGQPLRNDAKGRRLQSQIADDDGWRNPKQRRPVARGNAPSFPASVYSLDSDDETVAEDVANDVLAHAGHYKDAAHRRTSNSGVADIQPQTRDSPPRRKSAVLSEDAAHGRTSWEKDSRDEEIASLQRTLDSMKAEVSGLKAEIHGKTVLETELRDGKAALQQNIQLQQRQVDDCNQKVLLYESEIKKQQLEIENLRTQSGDKERECRDAIEKMKTSEQRAEKCAESLGDAEALCARMTQERDKCKVEVSDLTKELEKQNLEMQKMKESHEHHTAVLVKNDDERKVTIDRLWKELQTSKELTHTLQDTVDRFGRRAERDNSKIDALEKDVDRLKKANAALSAEQAHLLESSDGAEASLKLAREEVQIAYNVIDRNAGEISRMRENADQVKDHLSSLHSTLKKNDTELTSILDDNRNLRLIMKDVEDFHVAQVRSVEEQVQKLRCAREFGPRT